MRCRPTCARALSRARARTSRIASPLPTVPIYGGQSVPYIVMGVSFGRARATGRGAAIPSSSSSMATLVVAARVAKGPSTGVVDLKRSAASRGGITDTRNSLTYRRPNRGAAVVVRLEALGRLGARSAPANPSSSRERRRRQKLNRIANVSPGEGRSRPRDQPRARFELPRVSRAVTIADPGPGCRPIAPHRNNWGTRAGSARARAESRAAPPRAPHGRLRVSPPKTRSRSGPLARGEASLRERSTPVARIRPPNEPETVAGARPNCKGELGDD